MSRLSRKTGIETLSTFESLQGSTRVATKVLRRLHSSFPPAHMLRGVRAGLFPEGRYSLMPSGVHPPLVKVEVSKAQRQDIILSELGSCFM